MHNITKDIFYLIGTFLEVNDFRHMGSVNKKFFNFYRLTVEQTVLEKTGNANKIAALLHNAPEGLAWREQFTAEKGPKNNTLKTVLSSNILDRIKLYKTPILENPYRSIKLMLKYTAPEIFTAICKDFCIETELKKMLQMAAGNTNIIQDGVPVHLLIKYNVPFNKKYVYNICAPEYLYYAWIKKRPHHFNYLLSRAFIGVQTIRLFLKNRIYSAMYMLLPLMDQEAADTVKAYGDKRFICNIPEIDPVNAKMLAAAGGVVHT